MRHWTTMFGDYPNREIGAVAFGQGAKEEDNPFDAEDADQICQFRNWRHGWRQASKEAELLPFK